MTRRVLAVAVLASLCACGGGGPPTPVADARFTAQGEGPENALPLEPMRLGMWRRTSAGLQETAMVTAEESLGGRPVLMFESLRNPIALTETEQGLLLLGSVLDGHYPKPILHVPAKVRVGMEWEVWFDDSGPRYRYQVVSRKEEATAFGKLPVWEIRSISSATGDVFARFYAEGHGLLYANIPYDNGLSSLPFLVTQEGVFPLDDADSPTPPRHTARAALEPLPTPDPVEEYFDTASMVRHRGADQSVISMRVGQIDFSGGGLLKYSGYFNTFAYDGFAIGDSPETTRLGGEKADRSPSWPAKPNPDGSGFEGSDATGAYLLAADTWWSPRAQGMVGKNLAVIEPRPDADPMFLEELFIPSYSPHVLGYRFLERPNVRNDRYRLVDNALTSLTSQLYGRGRIITFPGKNPEDLDILIQTRDGIWWSTQLIDYRMRPPILEGRLPGQLSPTLSEQGREIFQVTAEGAVLQLRMVNGRLLVEHLVDVQLPPGERLVAAFPYRIPNPTSGEQQLVVATFDASYTSKGIVRFHRVKDYQPNPTPIALEPRLGIQARTAGGDDFRVCWPGSLGAGTTEGWSVGGFPATAVVPDGNCVLVVADREQIKQAGASANLVEGPVPGVGQVRMLALGDPPVAFDPSPGLTAALKGGGFVSERGEFGPGGTFLKLPCEQRKVMVADAAGNGAYVKVGERWSLVGRDRETPIRSDLGSVFASGGGGMVGCNGTTGSCFLVKPDGTSEALPHPAIIARAADGTLCRSGGNDVICRAPGGADVSAPFNGHSGFVPLVDGKFACFKPGEGISIFDPKTATFTVVAPSAMELKVQHASDGTAWVAGGELTSSGVKPHPGANGFPDETVFVTSTESGGIRGVRRWKR
jgi:hypothetical protein